MNKKQKLYVMIGIPGSGKSTYAKNNLPDTKYVSRDEIRFSLLKEGEPYFSKEKEAFNKFVQQINQYLKNGYDVVADATHLNYKSRGKLFSHLIFNRDKVKVIAIYMKTPLSICLNHNKTRLNTKTYVPEKIIIDMQKSLVVPNFIECNSVFDEIRTIINTEEKEKI